MNIGIIIKNLKPIATFNVSLSLGGKIAVVERGKQRISSWDLRRFLVLIGACACQIPLTIIAPQKNFLSREHGE
jgi:hypothetical protein